jgi:hypothetical protein
MSVTLYDIDSQILRQMIRRHRPYVWKLAQLLEGVRLDPRRQGAESLVVDVIAELQDCRDFSRIAEYGQCSGPAPFATVDDELG